MSLVIASVVWAGCALCADAGEVPWYKRTLVGMEVGPTGAQWGADPKDTGYAAKFSGTDIVEAGVKAGAEYLVIWAKDSEYAYYNSAVAPKCPGLGERDVLRETVEAAQPHHLPVIAYCVVQGNGYPLREHPDYKMVDAEGKAIDRLCLNSGYIEHAKAAAAEMIAYGIDGFHIDMLDQGFGPPYGCWCAKCRELFQAEFGEAMPPGVTWDAAWDKMLAFRYNTSERFEKTLRDYIRSINPKVSIDFNYHGYPPFSWEVGQRPVQHAHIGDFVTCESGVWGFSALGAGLTAKFVQATDPAASYQVVMQRGVRMYHDQTTRPLNDLRWEMFALLANGAQVTIVDKTPFDGTVDREAYDRIGKVFSEVHAKRGHFGQKPVQEVGLYYSSRTRDWVGRENPSQYEQSFFGAHKALVYEHIPYGVVLDENVSLDTLKAFSVVLLADAAILSPKEAALFEAYVKQGGNLLITGNSGMYGQRGELLPSSVLEPLIGARALAVVRDKDNFFVLHRDPEGMQRCDVDIPLDWPVLAYGPAVVYASPQDSPLTHGALLRPVRTLRQQAGLEGTEFPGSAGEPAGPAVLLHSVGQGKVLTLAVSPGAAAASEYRTVEARKLLRNALRILNPEPGVEIQAPLNIETVVTEDQGNHVLRIHCVGYLSPPGATAPNRPNVIPDPVEDAPMYQITVRLKQPFTRVTGINPQTVIEHDGRRITATIHDIHEVLIITP